MKRKISLLIFLLSAIIAHGQVTFQKTYGGNADDEGYCVQQTSDGGYIISGQTISYGAVGWDVYLIKTNNTGDTLWTKTFGGTNHESGYSVIQTNDGGYIVCGVTNSFSNPYDVYLLKTDSNGNLLWSKAYGGANLESGKCVQQTNDNGFIIAGHTVSYGAGNYDGYLIKTDSIGDTLWTKTYGGSGDDYFNYVRQTTDGGYILTGTSNSSGTDNSLYLVKTMSNGDTLWTRLINVAAPGQLNDEGYSVVQTNDGGYVAAGVSRGDKVFLIKASATGNLVWVKTFGVLNIANANDLQLTSDGGFIVGGHTFNAVNQSDMYLVKTDSYGNLQWSKTFGGPDEEYSYSVQQTTDNGYIICGFTCGFGAGGCTLYANGDVYLIKTDSLGNSGCNENIPVTTVNTPSSVSNSFSPAIGWGGGINSPVSLTGRGGNVNTLCLANGINEVTGELNNIFIFPNPASNELIFTLPNQNKNWIKQVVIYDILSKKVYSNSFTQNINVSGWSNGVYFVQLKGSNEIKTLKLVVQH